MVSNTKGFPPPPNGDPKPPNVSVRLLAIVFSIGATFGSGVGYGFSKTIATGTQPETTSQTKPITLAKYERLGTGISVTDAAAILGSGVEINRSETTATFVWENPDASKITAIFENGKLKRKEQSKLK
jgi:hypothetical protein